jgi:hypothetical protein
MRGEWESANYGRLRLTAIVFGDNEETGPDVQWQRCVW